jgi:7SK snRNA methylphosphate capping enzyme
MVSEEVISPIEADKLEKFGDLEMKAASTATSSTSDVETAKSSSAAPPVPATVSKPCDIGAKAVETTPPPPVTVTAKPKFGKQDASYQFGNYDRYYGYRNLNENIDVRFKVFARNAFLFKDKDILDIGCNVGLMAIAVGKNLHPRSVVGIDIDKNLIARARKNLSLYVRVPLPPPQPAPTAATSTKSPLPSTSTATATEPPAAVTVVDEQSTEKSTQTEAATKKAKPHYSHQHHHHNTMGKMARHRKKKTDFYPISFPINCGPIPNIDHFEVEKDEKAEDERFLFPRTVIFKTVSILLNKFF